MKKFWNKAENTNDIYIYGEIASERWDETETTAKSFVDDLKKCKNEVNVHVNSGGGDVFTALAIHNSLKSYKGAVNIYIDGLAASAASMIICAGDKVKMASNALVMVHMPSVGLMGYYNAAELEKVKNALVAVESSILDTYKKRLPEKNHSEVAKMMNEETWMTAEEAKEIGFVDEITGAVEMEVDDAKKLLIVNKVEFDSKKLGEKIKGKIQGAKKVEEKMDVKQANELIIQDAIKQAREQEVKRIKNLNALKNGQVEVDAVIEVAIMDGAEVSEVMKYVDAIKAAKENAPKVENQAIDAITAAIRDNMKSGAEKVGGSTPPVDKNEMLSAEIVKYANAMIGGAK